MNNKSFPLRYNLTLIESFPFLLYKKPVFFMLFKFIYILFFNN